MRLSQTTFRKEPPLQDGNDAVLKHEVYRSTSLIRNSAPLGSYRRTMPWALWWPLEGWLFLMSEAPL